VDHQQIPAVSLDSHDLKRTAVRIQAEVNDADRS